MTPQHPAPQTVNIHKINQIIGININENEYLNYLSKLKFDIDKDIIKVPSFRSDIKTQNDLAEEVARVIGYDNIPRSEISIPKNEKTIFTNPNRIDFEFIDPAYAITQLLTTPCKNSFKIYN